MKPILSVLAIATGLAVLPIASEAAPKYNERWQKAQDYRKQLVQRHRDWVSSSSRSTSSSASETPSTTTRSAVSSKPKTVRKKAVKKNKTVVKKTIRKNAVKKTATRKQLASLSPRKTKRTSERLGTSAKHLGRVEARVDLSEQKMRVYANGRLKHVWKVSTARSGKVTPTGTWTAKWLSKDHRSSRYNGAPMPYSIFYSGNFAVHGTNHIKRLGSPASAGCVRLHPDNARVLFQMAQNVGLRNLKVRVVR